MGDDGQEPQGRTLERPVKPWGGGGVRESCEAHSELVGSSEGEEAGQILSPETRGSRMDKSDGKDSCFGGTRVTFAVSLVTCHVLYAGLELLILLFPLPVCWDFCCVPCRLA